MYMEELFRMDGKHIVAYFDIYEIRVASPALSVRLGSAYLSIKGELDDEEGMHVASVDAMSASIKHEDIVKEYIGDVFSEDFDTENAEIVDEGDGMYVVTLKKKGA